MTFDNEIDQLKKEMADKRLAPEDMITATQTLKDELEKKISSKRISFIYNMDDEEGPRVDIHYQGGHFHIGTSWVQPDGSVVFSSDSEYFPPLIASENQASFLDDAYEFLKEGLALFELDEEDESYDA